MKKLLLLSFLCFTTSILLAQDSTLVAEADSLPYDTNAFHAFYLKTAPMTLGDLINGGSVNLELESFPIRKLSIAPEVSFILPYNGIGLKNNKGWKCGIEARYYLKFLYDFRGSESQYVGLRYMHKVQSYDYMDTIDIRHPVAYAKQYKVSKTCEIVHIVWGLRYLPANGIEKEFYMGIGMRYKESIIDGLTDDEIEARMWSETDMILPRIMSNGTTVDFDFTMGFRIGFGLK